jgi:hypothetical protein
VRLIGPCVEDIRGTRQNGLESARRQKNPCEEKVGLRRVAGHTADPWQAEAILQFSTRPHRYRSLELRIHGGTRILAAFCIIHAGIPSPNLENPRVRLADTFFKPTKTTDGLESNPVMLAATPCILAHGAHLSTLPFSVVLNPRKAS